MTLQFCAGDAPDCQVARQAILVHTTAWSSLVFVTHHMHHTKLRHGMHKSLQKLGSSGIVQPDISGSNPAQGLLREAAVVTPCQQLLTTLAGTNNKETKKLLPM